ncbi:glycosyltransferase [Georgenia sp. Z1344]|uniref:glycosyltransferase n=1 Tax=Georgenia sp. Z1344 TaxID=3416706 RepID=UPI003CE67561
MSVGPARRPDVCVVVPARDEEALIGRTLDSLRAAAGAAGAEVSVIVVADSCTDGTAAIARACGAEVLEIDARNVGAARQAGCDRALLSGAAPDPRSWIATTDADSVVPEDWVAAHLRYRSRQVDLVVGTVALEGGHAEDPLARAWAEQYASAVSARGHDHVHGANLGLSAQALRLLGGFRPLRTGEDVDLVRRAAARGLCTVRALDMPVVTSRRTAGRAPAGFAGDLADLAESLAPAGTCPA